MASDTRIPGETRTETTSAALQADQEHWSTAWKRRIRRVTGVDEELLESLPEERARYTRMGAAIILVGVMAGSAVFVTLSRFTDTPWPLLLPFALFYAGLIIVFDSCLIATMHGVRGKRQRWGAYGARVAIAVLMGICIAEPLLLFVFRPSIEHHLEVSDQQAQDSYRSALERCNPITGAADPGLDCTQEYLLTIPETPTPEVNALESAEEERDRLQEQVDAIEEEYAAKNDLARRECNGDGGEGLTGDVGQGPNCERLRTEADEYLESSQIEEYREQLSDAEDDVASLAAALRPAEEEFAERRAEMIDEKVVDRAAEEGNHGFLDEMRALHELSADSGYVFAGQVFLRLFLITIDVFPVLLKALGGRTWYDVRYTARLQRRSTCIDLDEEEALRGRRAEDERDRLRRQRDLRAERQEDHIHQAQHGVTMDAAIDDLAARYRGEE